MVLNLRKSVRRINKTIPILFMSAKDDLSSKQTGFRLGIDDYMVKPIELDELLLRVRALLRRANIAMSRKIKVVNLELDADVDHRNYCCFIYFSYKCL